MVHCHGRGVPMGKVTIQDVADYCHVAKSTVSLVLNGHERVSKKTRERIFEAIAALDYKPNLNAKNLKTNRNRTLGLIVDDLTNIYGSSIIKGIVQRAKFYDYDLFICECEWNQDRVLSYLDMLLQRKCEGIVFTTPMDLEPELNDKFSALHESRVPIVTILNGNVETKVNAIRSNDAQGATLALDHLIGLGHRRIAFIAGFKAASATKDKEQVYVQRMQAEGCFDPDLIRYTNFQPGEGMAAAKACLALPDPPTAFFAGGDMLAIGVLAAVREAHLNVPQDVSILGFGGIDLLGFTEPALSTVEVPRARMGEMAVDHLIQRINVPDGNPAQSHVVDTRLVLRSSTGRRPS